MFNIHTSKVATSEDGFQERIQAISDKNKEIIALTTSHEKQAEDAYQQLTNIVFTLDKKRKLFYDKIPEVSKILVLVEFGMALLLRKDSVFKPDTHGYYNASLTFSCIAIVMIVSYIFFTHSTSYVMPCLVSSQHQNILKKQQQQEKAAAAISASQENKKLKKRLKKGEEPLPASSSASASPSGVLMPGVGDSLCLSAACLPVILFATRCLAVWHSLSISHSLSVCQSECQSLCLSLCLSLCQCLFLFTDKSLFLTLSVTRLSGALCVSVYLCVIMYCFSLHFCCFLSPGNHSDRNQRE